MNTKTRSNIPGGELQGVAQRFTTGDVTLSGRVESAAGLGRTR